MVTLPRPLLDRHSKLPLYQQVYDILRSEIVRGAWRPGELIPTESELMERYGVSRITIRQVLNMLGQDGLIYRQRGRGTFVAHPAVEQGLVRIVNFTEDMRQRGFAARSRVLSLIKTPAPADIADRLRIAEGEELACIERLRLADDEPMSIEKSYLVHRLCPGVLKRHNFAITSLRETLEHEYGLRLTRAKQVIRADAATRAVAQLLTVPARSPLLLIERLSFSQHAIPVEFLQVRYRADRYALHAELHQ